MTATTATHAQPTHAHLGANEAEVGCCLSNGDCNDNNPCTADTCLPNATCENTAQSACCLDDTECNSPGACTENSCDTQTHTCQERPIVGCCENNSDCTSTNACQTAECDLTSNICVIAPVPNCCILNSECDDRDACTFGRCTDRLCENDPITPCGGTTLESNEVPSDAPSETSPAKAAGGCQSTFHSSGNRLCWLLLLGLGVYRRRHRA